MDVSDLRVAIFSGNYNYVRDGANQALNRLAGYLLRQGAAVRVYSPITKTPAFAPTGDLIDLPAVPVPGRPEYRIGVAIPPRVRKDLRAFNPNILHVASPEITGHSAVTLAHRWDLPVIASVHTRFETYPRYYGMAFLEPVVLAVLRRFYRRCDAIFAPSNSMAQLLRDQRMNYDVGIWSRGIDREIFNPGARDLAWRRSLGIEDDMPVIGFVGRLVMEKGLDVFSDTIDRLARRKVRHKVLVIGDGPAREWFEKRLPDAVLRRLPGGRRPRPRRRLDGHAVQPVGDRDVRQRHAGSDGGRPAGRRRDRAPAARAWSPRGHRPPRPPRRLRSLLRSARRLLRRRGGAARGRPCRLRGEPALWLGRGQPGAGRRLYPSHPPA